MCKKDPLSRLSLILLLHNCHTEIPSAPTEGNTYFCQQLPARSWNEFPVNSRSSGGGESFLLPRYLCFWQRFGYWQGRPAPAQSVPGGGEFLTSNYQFLYMRRTFFGTDYLFTSCLADSALANLFFGIFMHLLRCQMVRTELWSKGWAYILELAVGMGCWKFSLGQKL